VAAAHHGMSLLAIKPKADLQVAVDSNCYNQGACALRTRATRCSCASTGMALVHTLHRHIHDPEQHRRPCRWVWATLLAMACTAHQAPLAWDPHKCCAHMAHVTVTWASPIRCTTLKINITLHAATASRPIAEGLAMPCWIRPLTPNPATFSDASQHLRVLHSYIRNIQPTKCLSAKTYIS
jgi:hypothetical protein